MRIIYVYVIADQSNARDLLKLAEERGSKALPSSSFEARSTGIRFRVGHESGHPLAKEHEMDTPCKEAHVERSRRKTARERRNDVRP